MLTTHGMTSSYVLRFSNPKETDVCNDKVQQWSALTTVTLEMFGHDMF